VEKTKFRSILLPKPATLLPGNNVEATFDIVERIVQLLAFDNVVGMDGALDILYGYNAPNPSLPMLRN